MPIKTKDPNPKNNSYHKGLALENIAANYLQTNGLLILQHNFHCPFGEIDLVCKNQSNGLPNHQDELIFVEVRYRKNINYGTPEETITRTKQKKILLAIEHYLAQNKWTINLPYRIDVIAMSGLLGDLNIEWIQNAIYM